MPAISRKTPAATPATPETAMPAVTRKTATPKRAAAPVAAPAAAATTDATPAHLGAFRWVRLGDLVVATASSPHADLWEAPRTTQAQDDALAAEIRADGRINKPINAHDRQGVLVVCEGRRRTRIGTTVLGEDALAPVLVLPERPEVERRIAAHAANATSCPPNSAALARDLLLAREAGVTHDRLVSASGGVESRTRALLNVAERAAPRVLAWLETGTIGETAALRLVEGSRDHAIQSAALDLLDREIDAAQADPTGRSFGLTSQRLPDVRIDADGSVRVSVSACEEAIVRAAQAAGAPIKRQPKAAKAAPAPAPAPAPAAPAPAPAPAPVVAAPVAPAAPVVVETPAPAPAPVEAAPVAAPVAAPKAAPVAKASPAAAAYARALAVDPTALPPGGREYLAGLRAALAFLAEGHRPPAHDPFAGAVFAPVFPAV